MIEIIDLSKSFGNKDVLSNINLNIKNGEVFGVIGPNGAGKTTLLKCIMGIETYGGTIKLDGEKVSQKSQKEIAKKASHVPQETEINFEFSVEEIVEMGRVCYKSYLDLGKDSKTTRQALKRAGVFELRNRVATSLSGGELQKVFIARALAQDTQNLLLDEPTQHLDINNQIEIMELIEELSDNKSILCVFHDLNLASMYCDRLALIKDGEIASIGEPSEVIIASNIRKAYGQDVLVKKNPSHDSVYVVPKKNLSKTNGGSHVHVICGGGTGGDLLNQLKSNGYEVSAGVLNILDSDKKAADDYDVPVVTEAPFSQISDTSYRENLEIIEKSDAVMVTDFPVSEGNIKNLLAVEKALRDNKKTIYVRTDQGQEETFLTQESRELFEKLKENGLVVLNDINSALSELNNL